MTEEWGYDGTGNLERTEMGRGRKGTELRIDAGFELSEAEAELVSYLLSQTLRISRCKPLIGLNKPHGSESFDTVALRDRLRREKSRALAVVGNNHELLLRRMLDSVWKHKHNLTAAAEAMMCARLTKKRRGQAFILVTNAIAEAHDLIIEMRGLLQYERRRASAPYIDLDNAECDVAFGADGPESDGTGRRGSARDE